MSAKGFGSSAGGPLQSNSEGPLLLAAYMRLLPVLIVGIPYSVPLSP